MSQRVAVMVIALVCLFAGVASAEVQRLYVLDCGRNLGRDQGRWSAASLQRLQSIMDERKAQLWINHDKPQSDGLRYAPAYYE
jgi:hypothetical protein